MMNMNRIIVITLALVVLENTLIPWLVPSSWSDRLLPHLSFIMTIFVACFAGRHQAFLFGLGFGLLMDIQFYGNLIGPYVFGMALIGYLVGLVATRRQVTMALAMWLVLTSGMLLDTLIFLIYKLFSLTELLYGIVFFKQILPTAIGQLAIALLLYIPVHKICIRPSLTSSEDNSE